MRTLGEGDFAGMTRQERLDRRASQPAWWGLPVKKTIGLATSFLPRLMHDRLEQMGVDFAILYPTHCQLLRRTLATRSCAVPAAMRSTSS
jgi:hypothetical protein